MLSLQRPTRWCARAPWVWGLLRYRCSRKPALLLALPLRWMWSDILPPQHAPDPRGLGMAPPSCWAAISYCGRHRLSRLGSVARPTGGIEYNTVQNNRAKVHLATSTVWLATHCTTPRSLLRGCNPFYWAGGHFLSSRWSHWTGSAASGARRRRAPTSLLALFRPATWTTQYLVCI